MANPIREKFLLRCVILSLRNSAKTDHGTKSDIIGLICFVIFGKVFIFTYLEAIEDENERWRKLVQLFP